MCLCCSGRGAGGRGRMRGFGRRGRGGRGGGRGRGGAVPTKDELDAQLDAYNAKVLLSQLVRRAWFS